MLMFCVKYGIFMYDKCLLRGYMVFWVEDVVKVGYEIVESYLVGWLWEVFVDECVCSKEVLVDIVEEFGLVVDVYFFWYFLVWYYDDWYLVMNFGIECGYKGLDYI